MQGAGLPVRPRRATHPPPRQDRRGPRLRRRSHRCPLSPSPCRCVPASTALAPLTAKQRRFDGAAVPPMGRAMTAPTASARLGASNRDEAGAPRRFDFGLRPGQRQGRRSCGPACPPPGATPSRRGSRRAPCGRAAPAGGERLAPTSRTPGPTSGGPCGPRAYRAAVAVRFAHPRPGACPGSRRSRRRPPRRAGAAARFCSPSPHLLL